MGSKRTWMDGRARVFLTVISWILHLAQRPGKMFTFFVLENVCGMKAWRCAPVFISGFQVLLCAGLRVRPRSQPRASSTGLCPNRILQILRWVAKHNCAIRSGGATAGKSVLRPLRSWHSIRRRLQNGTRPAAGSHRPKAHPKSGVTSPHEAVLEKLRRGLSNSWSIQVLTCNSASTAQSRRRLYIVGYRGVGHRRIELPVLAPMTMSNIVQPGSPCSPPHSVRILGVRARALLVSMNSAYRGTSLSALRS
jgi:site-specific DNA-cytosine methylase